MCRRKSCDKGLRLFYSSCPERDKERQRQRESIVVVVLNLAHYDVLLQNATNIITKCASFFIKKYSSFSRKIFVFQKTCFKISSDCHFKMCRSLERRAILKISSIRDFRENYGYFTKIRENTGF